MSKLTFLTAFLVVACAGSNLARPILASSTDPLGVGPVSLPSALDRVLRDYERAWRAGDGVALAGLFTEDGIAAPNNRMPLQGRAAIAASITGPSGALMLRALSYHVSGDTGYIFGGYQYPDNATAGGKFVLALRRARNGQWFIAVDTENRSIR